MAYGVSLVVLTLVAFALVVFDVDALVIFGVYLMLTSGVDAGDIDTGSVDAGDVWR